MKKKLSTIGNSLGIVIEKPILELLKIDKETELELSTDGVRLIIEPTRVKSKRKLSKSLEKVMSKHDNILRKLVK